MNTEHIEGVEPRPYMNHDTFPPALWFTTVVFSIIVDSVALYLYSEVLMLAIRLPESLEKRLDRLAKRTGRTKTFYAREAILRHIEDLEDTYEAERVMERLRAGKERIHSLDEVAERLGLDD